MSTVCRQIAQQPKGLECVEEKQISSLYRITTRSGKSESYSVKVISFHWSICANKHWKTKQLKKACSKQNITDLRNPHHGNKPVFQQKCDEIK